MSMISLHIIKQNKVPLNITNIGYKVRDVQKNSVPHQGVADFEATSNGVNKAIRVVVSDNKGDNMLIAYQDQLKFNVIHANIPYLKKKYFEEGQLYKESEKSSETLNQELPIHKSERLPVVVVNGTNVLLSRNL